MRFILVASLAFGLATAAGGVSAQGIPANAIPAEIPPESFTGRQYVDSRGCVFVRAGISGNVTWVPRVSRSREQICNATPTNVAGAGAVAPRAPAGGEVETIEITPSSAAPAPAARTPLLARRPIETVATTAPAVPRVTTTPAQQRPVAVRAHPRAFEPVAPVVLSPAPAAAASGQRAVPSATPVRRITRAEACRGASALSTRYINAATGRPVRCGPQTPHPADVVRAQRGGAKVSPYGSPALGVPNSAPSPSLPVAVPPGYERVWEDDRLNPARGTPGSRYLTGGTGTIVHRPRAVVVQQAPHNGYGTRVQQQAYGTRLSARTTPSEPARVAAGGSYVQAGSFGVESNAAAAARRLQQAGLPVRIGRTTAGGRTLSVVLAGPFTDAARANGALAIVRGAGFSDAFLR